MKRRAPVSPVPADAPAFDPVSRGPSFARPEAVLVAALLYAFAHNLGPDRYEAARDLADSWNAGDSYAT